MSEATTISVRLSEAIAEGMLELAPDEVRIVLATYHLLSLGDPVLPSEIADEAGVDLSVVESRLASWPGVFKQDRALIGFWGLALPRCHTASRWREGLFTPGAPTTPSFFRSSSGKKLGCDRKTR